MMNNENTLRSCFYSVLLICLVAGFIGCSKEGSLSPGLPSGNPCSNIADTELAIIFGCPSAITSKTCGISLTIACSSYGAQWAGDTVKDGCTYAGLTMTVEGYVRDFLTDSCIPGSEVTIMDNETGQPLPLCTTSNELGYVKIEGIPFTTIGYRVRLNPADYKDTYKFNITPDEALNNQIIDVESCAGTYAATGLTFQTVNAPTSKTIALMIPIVLDKSLAVIAGTIKKGSWAGEGLEGFKATTDPPAESVNYMGTDGNPKCNPDPAYQGKCKEPDPDKPMVDCLPTGGCIETSLGDPVRNHKGAGVFVAFNVAVGQKVSMTAWWGTTPSATTDVFPYPDSVCISNMVVP